MLAWQYIFFFKQKTAYEMRISDWSSDVCSSDLRAGSQTALPLDAEIGLDRTRPHRVGGHLDDVRPQTLEPRDHQLAVAQHRRGDVRPRDVSAGFGAAALLGLDLFVLDHDEEQTVLLRSEEHTSELQSLMRI